MPEHTPGPWKFWVANNGGAGVSTADGKAIAICATGLGGSASEANARLIAAAPELLKAVIGHARNIRDVINGPDFIELRGHERFPNVKEALEFWVDLIHRAGGNLDA
jgi:hypothetical protein